MFSYTLLTSRDINLIYGLSILHLTLSSKRVKKFIIQTHFTSEKKFLILFLQFYKKKLFWFFSALEWNLFSTIFICFFFQMVWNLQSTFLYNMTLNMSLQRMLLEIEKRLMKFSSIILFYITLVYIWKKHLTNNILCYFSFQILLQPSQY